MHVPLLDIKAQLAPLAELLRILRVHGEKPKYYHKIIAEYYDGLIRDTGMSEGAGIMERGLVKTPKRVYRKEEISFENFSLCFRNQT